MGSDFQTFVFVHLEKCAGTSIRQMIHDELIKTYPQERLHIPGITCANEDNILYLSAEKKSELAARNLFCVADHTQYGALEDWLNLPRPFYFSLLREPVPRVVSHYYFFAEPVLQKPMTDLTRGELEYFLASAGGNLMTLKLSGVHDWSDTAPFGEKIAILEKALPVAKDNLNRSICFGLVEQMDRSIEHLNRTNPFGFQFKLERNTQRLNQNLQEKPVNDEVLAILRHFCRYDIELYDYARDLFAQNTVGSRPRDSGPQAGEPPAG